MARVFVAIDRAVDKVIVTTGIVGVALNIIIAIFVTLNVFARTVLNINIPGLFDGVIYGLVIFAFLPVAYTLRAGKHIAVDVVTTQLSARTQAVLRISGYLLASIFVFVLGWKAAQWASTLFLSGTQTDTDFLMPKGAFAAVIAGGYFLVQLQIVRMLVRDIRLLRTPKAPSTTTATGLRDKPLLCASLLIIGVIIGVALFIYLNSVVGLFFLLLLLLFAGMPVFFGLGLLGCFGVYALLGSGSLMQIPITAFATVKSFSLAALPLFILGGLILERGGIGKKIFRFAEAWSGRYASASLVATITAGVIFCAISGSSTAVTAVISAVALPTLVKKGYNKAISSGVVGGATVGTIVPPSLGYVVYCVMTEQSIGQLFIAAIIPSAVLFALYYVYVVGLGVVNKKALFENGKIPAELAQRKPVTLNDKLVATKEAIWGILTPVVILGGIFIGIFTATEAAAVLVVWAIIVCIITRQLTWKVLLDATLDTAVTTSMIISIIISAFLLALVVSQLQMSAGLLAFIDQSGLGQAGLIMVLFIALLILGFFMDSPSLKATTLPVFYAPCMALGVNPLWLGIFYQFMGEIALLTPPVGLNLFIMTQMSGIPLARVIKGNIPFVGFMSLTLLILYLFPDLVTWLPSLMMK